METCRGLFLMSNIKNIRIDEIDIEISPRVRAAESEIAIENYSENYRLNKPMPPIVVYVRKGKPGYILSDGLHRVIAATQCGMRDIPAEIREGEWESCLEYALIANAHHGLPRSSDDKRLCAEIALKQWPKLSNAIIAERCEVGDRIVDEVRKELESKKAIPETKTRVSADGRERPATRTKKAKAIVDKLGMPIPEAVQQYWIRGEEPKVMIDVVTDIMKKIKEFKDNGDVMYGELNHTGILADLEKARRSMATAVPYVVCTQCGGHPETQRNGCRLCLGRGLISEFRWKTVPEEIRAMRERLPEEEPS